MESIPGRVIFNNCVLFVGEVRKITGKRNLSEKELETMKKATLIAALSSNHSWKTSKYLNNYCELDKDALSEEFAMSAKEGWKSINENDVEEVINGADRNGPFNPFALSMYFYHAMDDHTRKEYTEIFGKMQKELAYGLEPMEKRI